MPRSRITYGRVQPRAERSASAPTARRSTVAVLTATAVIGLTAFAVSPLPAEFGLTSEGCAEGKALRQLSAARETRAETRALLADLTVSSDPRAQALTREITGLGFTPASQPAGWRQKAVDVSDQLNGTEDPKLRQVAVRLAKAGLGPTPADLLPRQQPPPAPGPGPLQGIGESLGGAKDTAVGAVASAGEAAKNAAAPPQASTSTDSSRSRGPAMVNPGRQAEPALPKTCIDQPKSTAAPAVVNSPVPQAVTPAPAAPAADPPEQTAVPLPSYSSEPPAEGGSAPEEQGSEEADSDSSGEPGEEPDTQEDGSGSAGSSRGGDSEAKGSGTGSGGDDYPTANGAGSAGNGGASSSSGGGSTQDLEKARAAIQLLGELMQTLGATQDGDAADLSEAITQVMDSGQLGELKSDPGNGGSGGTDSSSSGSGSSDPGPGADDEGQSAIGDSPKQDSGGTSGDWEAGAEKLAEQVQEAADADPLAQQLADKLDDAGISADGDSSGDSEDRSSSPGGSSSAEESDSGPSEASDQDASAGAGTGDERDSQSQGAESAEPPDPSEQASGDGAGSGTDESGGQDPRTGSDPGGSGGSSDAGEQSSGDEQASAGEQPRDPEGADADSATSGTEPATWDKLAECESSGDWSTDTGNGYKGGLQFDPATWQAFGGKGDPAQASKAEQIAVAEKVQAEQGWNAWPACSERLGLV